MVMNFIGLTLGFTAFMVLMVQVGYQRSFDRNHPTSGRIYRVDKIGMDKEGNRVVTGQSSGTGSLSMKMSPPSYHSLRCTLTSTSVAP